MTAKIIFRVLLVCLIANTLFFTSSCKKEELARVKFLGSYNVNENCDSGNWTYVIAITESSTSEDAVVISNFGNYSVNVRATISGDNISMNDTQNGITFSGSGNISGNTLTIIYTASSNGNTDNCTKTCIRQ